MNSLITIDRLRDGVKKLGMAHLAGKLSLNAYMQALSQLRRYAKRTMGQDALPIKLNGGY